ncbi:MAG: glycosyltransferase [Methylotenera sp.]|jgi:glycosyltransferase involved in cell wall biosynthesis|uniref:glycosyltransferase n=1 Tax=Methylotenera sp. TaxID=2051956 RepID=UPI00271C2157|nr:glycosyltransferase [Methylotenera sp.]MDO9149906.1 glycosyltransferase [Methylotenera sp.]
MSTKVSIVIKALNEQANIARVLRSAIAAANAVSGEVILADSFSTDETVEIAKNFAIKIVQLIDPNQRSCGIGAQLGYQYAQGEYVYILDADMEIEIDFLRQAIELMNQDKSLGGVGGLVKEMHLDGLEFKARVQRAADDMSDGVVDHLAMGGLYRREAINQVGYLTNRNLHSYEEFELGIRLRTAGWRLVRLPIVSVKHYGHTMPAYRLLKRRWKSRYSQGLGELIRASFGKAHMSLLMREMTDIKLYVVVIFWWIALLMILAVVRPWSIMMTLFVSLLALPFFAMVIKKRDFSLGVYSVVAWQYLSAGMILGLMQKQTNPIEPIASNEINLKRNS